MTKLSQYDKSVVATLAARPNVKQEFLPLFDHLVNLAASSHKQGYAKRAGRELLQARQLVTKYGAR